MSALNALTESLVDNLQSFLTKVSVLSAVPVSNLVELWCRVETPIVREAPKRGRKVEANGPKCDYVFQKGKNPGKVCGETVCSDSDSKCRKHLKFEGSAQATTKTSSVLSGSVLAAAKELSSGVGKPVAIRPATAQLSITRNEHGNYEHKATNFVFNQEKLVYGKQVGDKVLPLTASDVENCKRHSFKYLAESLAKPETTTPQDDEEEIEYEEVEEEVEEVEEVEE
jgi:hypothetical protein